MEGVSIQGNFTQIQGRQLTAPKLKVGNGEDLVPRFGRWNFRGKKMVEPAKIQKWAIVNFSVQRCDVQKLSNDFCRMAQQMGMVSCSQSSKETCLSHTCLFTERIHNDYNDRLEFRIRMVEVPLLDGSAREWVEAIERVCVCAAKDDNGNSMEKLAPFLLEPAKDDSHFGPK
ncbi:hypothetical protein ACHQM5_006533 [Ranunculus cassubicifolius]